MKKNVFNKEGLIKLTKELPVLQIYMEASKIYFRDTKNILEDYNLSDRDKVIAINNILKEFESKVISK